MNQFCNWRVHYKHSHYSMPTKACVSTMLAVRRPWHDEHGNYWYDPNPTTGEAHPKYDPTLDVGSMDMEIDAIALFVSGTEHHHGWGPSVGLYNTTISAMLIDDGPD